MNATKRAYGLGWLSLGLGLIEIAAPQVIEQTLRIKGRSGLLRAIGVRELISGAGILLQSKPTPWLWSRVAGDVMDVALLVAGLGKNRVQRSRIAGATGVVVAIGLLDLACARALSSRKA